VPANKGKFRHLSYKNIGCLRVSKVKIENSL